jgi:hypothetical protein
MNRAVTKQKRLYLTDVQYYPFGRQHLAFRFIQSHLHIDPGDDGKYAPVAGVLREFSHSRVAPALYRKWK